MESECWSVVFEGKVVTGRRVEDVKKILAILFKANTGQIEQLFAGPKIAIKKNLSHPTAMKYKMVLEHAGALCSVERADTRPQPIVKKEIDSNATPVREIKSSMACPVCSYEQDGPEECFRCGTLYGKNLEKKNRQPDDQSLRGSNASRQKKPLDPHKLMVFWFLPLIAALILVISNWRWDLPISLEPSRVAPHKNGRVAPRKTGQVAPRQPSQTNIRNGKRFLHKSYRVTPLAIFQIEALVLSKKRYYFGREAELSPVDLAVGWGPMSDERAIQKIKIRQQNRFYFWSVGQFPPMPPELIAQSSANMHIIPANKEIAKRLKKIRKGQIVVITGYLVRVDGENFQWQSSLTRNDTGAGACEVVWTETLDVL